MRRASFRCLRGIALCLLLLIPPAWGEERIALVIGNSAYANSPLASPGNDARLLSAALRADEFRVTTLLDADRGGMLRAIHELRGRLAAAGPEGVGLFYFSGHGAQSDGHNYLLPVGGALLRESDLPEEAVDADAVLRGMAQAGNRLNILVLDAARNAPLGPGARSSSRGLAPMDVPPGTVVAWATEPGTVAADGGGPDSLYASFLARYLLQPGLEMREMFAVVARRVRDATRDQAVPQVPMMTYSQVPVFYFQPVPRGAPVAPARPADPIPVRAPQPDRPGPAEAGPPVSVPGPAARPDPPAAAPARAGRAVATKPPAVRPAPALAPGPADMAPDGQDSAEAPAGQGRLALVIGNSSYGRRGAAGTVPTWPDLEGGPLKDADAMAARLQELHFTVVEVTDQSLGQMQASLQEFGARIGAAPDSLALFYYAGHGVLAPRPGGEDIYLIPVDTDLAIDVDAPSKALSLAEVGAVLRRSRAGVVILDAGRGNALRRSRSAARGPHAARSITGVLLASSTPAGEVGENHPGQMSEYTQLLVGELGTPGQTLTATLRSVRRQMEQLRGGAGALPEVADALDQDIVLVPQ